MQCSGMQGPLCSIHWGGHIYFLFGVAVVKASMLN